MRQSLYRVIILGFCLIGNAMAIEEPKYEVIVTDDAFSVRHYPPILIAETTVDGDMDKASNQGFRLIADFIFGNNEISGSSQNSKIQMTAPVTVEPQSSKIAMTAPVTVEPSRNTTVQDANQWRIHFVMPSQYTLQSIPHPKNPAVTLREIPEKYFAVLSYSGFNTESNVQRKINDALAWVQQRGYVIKGTPQLARYNPPWTLPMFRRNEILVEIQNPSHE
jgi:SOUL heme-binding protein